MFQNYYTVPQDADMTSKTINIDELSCQQSPEFKKGTVVASLNNNGHRSHLDEVHLVMKR